MTVQTIRSVDGRDYVLVPVAVYQALKSQIDDKVAKTAAVENAEYVPFVVEDYVSHPVSLARLHAGVTQAELARRLGVTQAYISKVEAQDRVTAKLLARVKAALG